MLTHVLVTNSISVTSGSVIFVGVQVSNSATVSSITDSSLNTYTRVVSAINGSLDSEIWKTTTTVASSGALTLTITTTGSPGLANILAEVVEIQSTCTITVDTTGTNAGTGGSATVTLTTASGGELVLVAAVGTNADGFNSLIATTPDSFVIQANPTPAPAGQTIAGGILGYFTTSAGPNTVAAEWAEGGTTWGQRLVWPSQQLEQTVYFSVLISTAYL